MPSDEICPPLPEDAANVRRAAWAAPPQRGLGSAVKIVLVVLLALATGLRVWLCLHDDGIYWPDEIYQSLEPAHRLVFGYGLLPWEFVDGARNWAFAGLASALLRVATWVVGEHPRHYLLVIRLAFCALQGVTAWGTYRLARSQGAEMFAALLAVVLFVLSPVSIYFAPRALSESAAAATVVFGLALTLKADAVQRDVWLGTSLLGTSVLFRLQDALFCLCLLAVLLLRRRFRVALLCIGILTLWALIYGALDRLTWGGWFHSAVQYLRFNVTERKSEQWGVSDSFYYLRILFTSMPLIATLTGLFLFFAARKSAGLLTIVVCYVGVHSLIAHKELRFMFPVLPLVFAIAAIGITELQQQFAWPPRALCAIVAAPATIAALNFHQLTFGRLGQYGKTRTSDSAYDDFGSVNRLLLVAHDLQNLCGIALLDVPLAWAGGTTYLHRKVPIYGPNDWRDKNSFNYAIVDQEVDAPVVVRDGQYSLVVLPQSPCSPDPGYDWRLP